MVAGDKASSCSTGSKFYFVDRERSVATEWVMWEVYKNG